MLRQKYSKKKRREKQKKRRKTRKIGGTKNPKRKISKKKREAAAAMSKHPEVLDNENRDTITRLTEEANRKEMERMLSEAGAAPGESEAGASAAADEVPQSCSAKARRHPVCRTCGWTKDPGAVKKCKCCPGSPQAEAAVASAKASAEPAGASKDSTEPSAASGSERYLSDPEIDENMRDNVIPNNSEEFAPDDLIRQSIEAKPIKCPKGSKKPNCKGNKGVKARKRDRQNCRKRGGKVLDRNKRNERCRKGGIQMQPITHDGDSDNRGTMPQRNPGISQRAVNLEAAFGSSEHRDPHATEMVTESCARVVGPNRDIYYAEVNEAGDSYTGEVTRDIDSPMCRPKAAAAGPASESGSFNDPDYMTSIVSTLPGVDVNDPALQEAMHGSASDISQPVPSSEDSSAEVSPGGGESTATSTVGSCRRTIDADGRSYLYNSAGESTWDENSSVCHRSLDCFTLNYTLTLNKVF